MKRMPTWLTRAVLLLWSLTFAPVHVAAQSADRSFAWFAELVSFDQTAKTVTVRAPIQEHVAEYIDEFTASQPIVMVWSQYDGEADVVIYVERLDLMETRSGYLVHASYVASDVTARTLTFAVPVGDGMVETLASAQAGTPIKVESPMLQPEGVTVFASVVPNERPKPRPEREPEPEELVADADAPMAQLAGSWQLDSSLQGNPISFTCAVTQEGAVVSGQCEGEIGTAPLSGQVAGNTAELALPLDLGGNEITFTFSGVVDDAVTRMEGTVIVGALGSAGFTGTRQ